MRSVRSRLSHPKKVSCSMAEADYRMKHLGPLNGLIKLQLMVMVIEGCLAENDLDQFVKG